MIVNIFATICTGLIIFSPLLFLYLLVHVLCRIEHNQEMKNISDAARNAKETGRNINGFPVGTDRNGLKYFFVEKK